MATASKEQRARANRLNLRLSPEVLNAVDAARGERAGKVSRNTWITEAIEEKLARERGPENKKGEKRGA